MREKLNERVGVVMICAKNPAQTSLPYAIRWQNKDYRVGKIGFHHKIKRGETLHHIYELVDIDNTLWFRLDFDTHNLVWTLDAISDDHG